MNAAVLDFSAHAADRAADRRAALLLHAMDAADRRWILQALPVQAQAVLQPLVAELDALGLERDPALVEQALRAGDPAGHGAGSMDEPVRATSEPTGGMLSTDERFLMTLEPAQVRQLVAALSAEPPELIRLVLTTRAWPWHAAVMNGLNEPKRLRVQEGLGDSMRLGDAALDRPALRAAVLRVLVRTTPRGVPQPNAARAAWHDVKRRAGALVRLFNGSSP